MIQGVDSGLVLKNSTDHKENVRSIEISPTNNNIFFLETIDLNAWLWGIHSLSPMEMTLELDQMNPPIFLLIQYSTKG